MVTEIIFRAKINRYFKQLNEANEELQQLILKRSNLLKLKGKNEQSMNTTKNLLLKLTNEKQMKVAEFNNWLNNEMDKLNKIREQIRDLEMELKGHNIKGIQFDLAYEDLQKSNPWFTEKFRDIQTKLFILALKVRKTVFIRQRKKLKCGSDYLEKTR